MNTKSVAVALVIFAVGMLAGCLADRWVGVEPGEYVVANWAGTANTAAAAEIQKLEIDQGQRLAIFTWVDGSKSIVPFAPRGKAAWPSGCPTNINSTRMEVLDLEENPLTIGSITLSNPVLVRECPPDPVRVILREDGAIGGGGNACAHRDQCVIFEQGGTAAFTPASPPPLLPSTSIPSPTATFSAVPTPTPSDWSAADPHSLPDEDLVLYKEGANLKSLPHRPVFDRPEISQIYLRGGESFGMFVRGNGPVASPDGRYLVLKQPGHEPPPPELPTWLVDIESGQIQKLEVKGREAAGAGTVTWSPDGCCVTFVVEDTLYVYDVQADAEPVPIFTQPGLRRLFASWSPTGEWIAVASDANPQDTVSAKREYIYWLISPDGAVIRNLGQHPVGGYGEAPYIIDWSPDGKTLLTPSQCLISSYDGSATCGHSTIFNRTDPIRWLPRAWTRLFLSRQFAEGEGPPSFFTWTLSPGGRRIAYSLYDDAVQQSDLYVFDRSTNSHRRVGVVSDYIIKEIRWAGGEEFLVLGLGDPTHSVEGGPVILLFDAHEAGPPRVLVEGENLYLIDVIPNYPAAGATPAPTTGSPQPASTPVPVKTGPVVDLPGSNYAVVELNSLDWPACCLDVAPDGERLAFATCHTMVQKIYVQNVDGSGLKEINSLRTHDGDGTCPDPAWSPDGRQLAFANYDYGLNVVNADGTSLTRLEPEGSGPVWSPDGQQIAFTARDLAIALMDRDGSNFRLLTGYEARDQRPAWSPDGQHIAFVSDRDGNREIYVMNSDGSDQQRLTYHEAQDWGPVWSPDGRYIVFTSDRNGHNGIYVMNRDGTGERWLMDTDAPQRWPMDTTRVRFIEYAKR